MELHYLGSGLFGMGQYKAERAVCRSSIVIPYSCDIADIAYNADLVDMHKVDGPFAGRLLHIAIFAISHAKWRSLESPDRC